MSRIEKFLKDSGIVNISKQENVIEPDYRVPYKPIKKSLYVENIRRISSSPEKSSSPKMHYQMIDAAVYDEGNVSLIVHREGAKSTKITRDLILTTVLDSEFLFGKKITNIMIFSATHTQAVDLLKNIKTYREQSDFFSQAIPIAKNKQGKNIAYNESVACFNAPDGRRVYVQAKSVLSEMRGTSKETVRPQLVILDDILKQSTLVSKNERNKTIEWYQSVLVLAMSTEWRKVIAVGTPMTEDDILALFSQSSSFLTLRFPIYQIHDNKKYSSWSSYHTLEKIEREQTDAKELGLSSQWNREKLLKIISGDARIFKDEDFKFYSSDMVKDNLKYMNIYTSIDMAVAQTESSDLTSIITVGVDAASRVFILRIDIGKLTPAEIIRSIIDHARQFGSEVLVGERASLQQVLNFFLEEELFRQNIYMDIIYVKNNTNKSKLLRIKGIEPTFEARRLFIPIDVSKEGVKELIKEMKGFSREGKTTRYDDVVDSLANLFEEGIMEVPTDWSNE